MNLKPLIKVLKLFLLKAVSLFITSPTNLPQGSSKQKGFQQLWGRCGINGSLRQPWALKQRAGKSQAGRDKWLCAKSECKPKPIGSKNKMSLGCTEESIYREVTLEVNLLCDSESQHGYIHVCMPRHGYIQNE